MAHITFATHPTRIPQPLSAVERIVLAVRSTERELGDAALRLSTALSRAMGRAKAEHRARILEREMVRLDPRLQRDIGYGPDRFGHGF